MNWNTLDGRLVERARARSCSSPLLDLIVPIEDWPRCSCPAGSTTLQAAAGRRWPGLVVVFGVQPAAAPRRDGVRWRWKTIDAICAVDRSGVGIGPGVWIDPSRAKMTLPPPEE